MTEYSFRDQVAIVTGGSSGIGFGIAQALATNGATVYLVARNQEKLQRAQKKITQQGGKAEVRQADITDLQTIKSVITGVYNQEGRLDIFVNNAGTWHGHTIGDPNEELNDLEKLLRRPAFEISHELIQRFRDKKSQLKILTVSSQAGLRFLPGNLGYGRAKMGIPIDIVHLQGEMQKHGINNIKLYSIYPGTTETEGVKQAVQRGEIENPIPLECVVNTAIDLLSDGTPTNHAYIGYEPNTGIVKRYYEINPDTFNLLPQHGEEQIISPDSKPKTQTD
jgi:NAD(P)-dependent dehydrogenase (short-subunit alcohol dehydrogenase family)